MSAPRTARVDIAVSEDALAAVATVVPATGTAVPLSVDDVTGALATARVQHGLDQEAVKGVVAQANAEGKRPQKAVVARGEPRVDAIPLHIELEHEENELDMEAARVDYRAIQTFILVKEGQTLGRVVKATPGKDGTDVLGRRQRHRTVSKPKYRLGPNVSQQGAKLVSKIDGRLEIRGNLVRVNEVLALEDVDYSSGNVEYHGDVVITGRVADRFEIRVGGSLFAQEALDASAVTVKYDLVARTGVIGRSGQIITVGGEVQAKHLQNVHIRSGAFVIVGTIVNSTVEAAMGVAARRIMQGCRIIIGDEQMIIDRELSMVRITADEDGKLRTDPVILGGK